MIRVEQLSTDDSRWSAFVQSVEWANIYHSPELNQVYDLSGGFKTRPLFAFHGDKPVACAMPVLVRTRMPVPGRLRNRLILYASPLYVQGPEGREGLNAVLSEAKAWARSDAFFLEIRNSESFPRETDRDVVAGMEFIPRLNYLIDLTQGAEALFARIGTEMRNHVRKAAKKGIVIRELENETELRAAIQMISRLYERKRVPMAGTDVFETAWRLMQPKGLFRATGGFQEGRLVVVRFQLCYAATVTDWYAASDPDSHRDYPNEAMVWHCLEWACGKGYRRFDFGGGGMKGQYYGPGRFKEKFRGETVEYGRYRYSPWPLLVRLAEKLYDWRTRTG